MVARVRDPIDGWGGGQAPIHQVKSASCMPPTPRDHVGYVARLYSIYTQQGYTLWYLAGLYSKIPSMALFYV
jgi:hypothetical protein